MNKIASLQRWMLSISRNTRILVQSLVSAIVFYCAAFLSTHIANVIEAQNAYVILVHLLVFLIFATATIFVFQWAVRSINALEEKYNLQTSAISLAYKLTDRLVVVESGRFERAYGSPEKIGSEFSRLVESIQENVVAAYQVLESSFGSESMLTDRIDFEVTFITESISDGHLIIPASANKDGRQPRSMVLRKEKAEIYDTTVAAAVYRMDRPTTQFIGNTDVPSYAELYAGQKERIRSSIIFPVLSNENRLLGTLVAHCDQSGFFKPSDRKFWEDLFEVFAKRIANRMILVEIFTQQMVSDSSIAIPLPTEPLY